MKKGLLILGLPIVLVIFVSPLLLAQTVRIGYSARALTYLPLFVAQDKGFYEAEGLQGQLQFMQRTDLHLQAIVTGDLHFATFNPDGIILFNEKGGNLKVISGVANAAPYLLIGAKQYKKPEDLKGGKLGVSALKGGTGSLVQAYLKSKGILYPRDYALVVIAGGNPAQLSALETGAIAAAALGIPFSDIALEQGLNRIGDVMEVLPKYQFNAINLNPAWAEKNRATVVKMLKAHLRSLRWIHDHRSEAADLFVKLTRTDLKYVVSGVDYFIKNGVFPADGSVSLEGLKANIDFLSQDGLLTGPLPSPEKYVDSSYLRQAQNELGR